MMSIASWNGERMDWAKVIEENLLKQLWSQPLEVPANQLVQKYMTIDLDSGFPSRNLKHCGTEWY
jgi:hypothetical protein